MFRVPPISNTEEINICTFSKVLGLFAFRKETLIEIAGLETTPFESLESIEQMRMIENCYQINSIKLDRGFPSVNVPSDINVVNHALLNDAEQANVLKSVIDAIKS
jgi:3-deoxy-manno-octulosonate cytidylyltransferase (CMP-KDO synthetase)